MTYSENQSKDFSEILSITARLSNLSPGQVVKVTLPRGKPTQRAKSLLYEWLYQNGLKKLFRIRSRSFGFEIERLGLGITSVEITSEFPKHLEQMLEQLIRVDQPAERVAELLMEGIIKKGEDMILLSKLNEIYGKLK